MEQNNQKDLLTLMEKSRHVDHLAISLFHTTIEDQLK